MIRLFFCLIAVTLLTACKKKQATIVITGSVTDTFQGSAIQNVNVKLEVQEVSGGTFSSSYTTIETLNAASGTYRFEFDRKNASTYRLTFSTNSYFEEVQTINPDDLSTEVDNIRNSTMSSQAWLRVNLKNVNGNDEVTYQVSGDLLSCGAPCCSQLPLTLYGPVDTTFLCLNTGGHSVQLNAAYVNSGIGGSTSQNIFLVGGDTTEANLFY